MQEQNTVPCPHQNELSSSSEERRGGRKWRLLEAWKPQENEIHQGALVRRLSKGSFCEEN